MLPSSNVIALHGVVRDAPVGGRGDTVWAGTRPSGCGWHYLAAVRHDCSPSCVRVQVLQVMDAPAAEFVYITLETLAVLPLWEFLVLPSFLAASAPPPAACCSPWLWALPLAY